MEEEKRSCIVFPAEMGMYKIGNVSYLPAFSISSEILHSGPHVFHIHRVIGRWITNANNPYLRLFTKEDPGEQEWHRYYNGGILVQENHTQYVE